MVGKGNLVVFESSNISETRMATPIKIGVHAPGLGSSTVGLVLKCNKYRLLEYLYLYLILTFKYILYFTCT